MPSASHIQRCKALVNAVEVLSQTEIDEMFKLIHQSHTTYTRNNNGVFMNLTWIDEETLTNLENYVKFCKQSRTELLKFESICDVLNSKKYCNTSENDRIKDKQTERATVKVWSCKTSETPHNAVNEIAYIDPENEDTVQNICGLMKVSSSTRFALLKKRFAKQCVDSGNSENENYLKQDPYICI